MNIQSVSAGLFLPSTFGVPVQTSTLPPRDPGLVKNNAEAETWFVRDQTPITIQILVAADGVVPLSLCTEKILPG